MQPDVHRGRIVRVPGVVKLFGEFLPCAQAAIEPEKLHHVYDRISPIELLLVLSSETIKDCRDIESFRRRPLEKKRKKRSGRPPKNYHPSILCFARSVLTLFLLGPAPVWLGCRMVRNGR